MYNFAVAQFFGVVALIVLLISFQKNEKRFLLKLQSLSSLLFALQYLFLQAMTGFWMHSMCLIRNLIFNRYNERKIPIVWLILILIGMFALGVVSYNGPISILPTVGVMIYTIGVWQKNMTITRITELIACLLHVVYSIKVLAISGLVSLSLEVVLVSTAIFRFDIKTKLNKNLAKN